MNPKIMAELVNAGVSIIRFLKSPEVYAVGVLVVKYANKEIDLTQFLSMSLVSIATCKSGEITNIVKANTIPGFKAPEATAATPATPAT